MSESISFCPFFLGHDEKMENLRREEKKCRYILRYDGKKEEFTWNFNLKEKTKQ